MNKPTSLSLTFIPEHLRSPLLKIKQMLIKPAALVAVWHRSLINSEPFVCFLDGPL